MKKSKVGVTAQVNLAMLANLGIEEAVHFQIVFQFSTSILDIFSHLPMSGKLPICISMLAEILYKRTNEIIMEIDNPVILDLACGYSPRILKVGDGLHTYIGVDLPEVVADLKSHFKELTMHKESIKEHYYSADISKDSEFHRLMTQMKDPVTVITQGLLTYLTLDQKQVLMDNIKALLKKNGGCWVIPDAEPDRTFPDLLRTVLGSGAYSFFKKMMKIVDTYVKRDSKQNGWFNIDEICQALEENGFRVKRVPLYTDSLELESLHLVSTEKAEKVIRNLKERHSLIVTVD